MSFEIYPDSIVGGGNPREREEMDRRASPWSQLPSGAFLFGVFVEPRQGGAVNSAEAWMSGQDTSEGTLDIDPDVPGVCPEPDLEFLLCSLSIWWNLQSVWTSVLLRQGPAVQSRCFRFEILLCLKPPRPRSITLG